MQRHPYLIAVSIFVLGVAGGFFGERVFMSAASAEANVVREGGYQYINPLISCNISEDTPYEGFNALQQRLQKQANQLIASGDAKRISIYFRAMDEGYWTGVRSSDLFAPASLMKVPLLMAYLKDSQKSTTFLQTPFMLSVPEDENAAEYFKPAVPLSLGKGYTVQELLNAMIEGSDNNATYVLSQRVNESTLEAVHEYSNIPPVVDESADTVSPKDYMVFFRVLYNAAFLGKTRSQAALELLGKTEFKDGIVAGVPASTPVVHKFGERSVATLDPKTKLPVVQERELHDCGIVYYHGHPYGLCIMTEGIDFTQLEKVIAAISKTAYAAVADGLLAR